MYETVVDTRTVKEQSGVLRADLDAPTEAQRTNEPVRIQIVGAPVACAEGVNETWRDLAMYFAGQLHRRYGPAVEVNYHDLFDSTCPPLPADAQLPLVLVDGDVLSSGGKLSMPAIRRHMEGRGVAPVGHRT